MALIIAALFVLGFVANVVIGSMTGTPIVGDVAEMCLLFAGSIAFVVAILKREAVEKDSTNSS